ncbi:MAG: hypothetical protein DI630_06435 [Gordonia sp. (in: high G+C Gram-positive bacteria)]|nr:MAG: hypothetical protein DI630_06435 [Gordonia sp. (in: high G+C Gram-positive bacteria)]
MPHSSRAPRDAGRTDRRATAPRSAAHRAARLPRHYRASRRDRAPGGIVEPSRSPARAQMLHTCRRQRLRLTNTGRIRSPPLHLGLIEMRWRVRHTSWEF